MAVRRRKATGKREARPLTGLLIQSFNGKPKASVFQSKVAAGLPLNENFRRGY